MVKLPLGRYFDSAPISCIKDAVRYPPISAPHRGPPAEASGLGLGMGAEAESLGSLISARTQGALRDDPIYSFKLGYLDLTLS